MEDPFKQMEELLISWKLPQLCQLFKDQEISIETLDALTDADIIELIPKVGPRAVFRKRLTEWLDSAEIVYTEPAEKAKSENSDTHYYKIETLKHNENIANETNLPSDELAISNEVEIEIEDNMWIENVSEENSQYGSLREESTTASETEEFLGVDVLEDAMEEAAEPKQANADELQNKFLAKYNEEPQSFKKGDSDVVEIEAFPTEFVTQRHVNVEQILLSTDLGHTIMQSYELNQEIDKKTRIYIADLLISEVFARNLVLDRAKFQDIAQQIIELFPSENIKTWFIAQNGCSRNSGGTLFNKYYTVYRKMRKTGFYEHYMGGVTKATDVDSSINPEQIDDEPEKLALKRAIPKYERLRRSCDFEKIHVKTLLESSFEGRGIVEAYDKREAFDVQTRNRLCKLIVMEASRRNIQLRPRNFYDISCQIVDLFPNETIDMYFLPRGRTPPKGCLYHKYLYIRRRLRQIGVLNKTKKEVK